MRLFILAAVAVVTLLVAAESASACHPNARFFIDGHGNVRAIGGARQVRGRNGIFSAGGRRAQFVGFDRFGNPIFR
jgi:opacity protein-like surface antigen